MSALKTIGALSLALSVFGCASVSSVNAFAAAPGAQVQTDSQGFIGRLFDKPVPGGTAAIMVGSRTTAPVVTADGHRVMVLRDGDQWVAVVGIALSAKPGPASIKVQDAGSTRTVTYQVGTKNYEAQHIKLANKRQVNPNPEDLKRFKTELAEQTAAYQLYSPGTPSNVLLDRPVPGRLSSPFGLKRFFNGEERNPHSGLDFAAPQGTPVKAPAAGKIILIGDYFFNGRTVFIDHGQGMITMFCHLSEIDVKLGQSVARGEVVAKVGATGRATGPHLHWNMSLNNVRVDPAIFIGAFTP